MSGLVNARFSLPEWQAIKMIFFAPWLLPSYTSPWRVNLGEIVITWNQILSVTYLKFFSWIMFFALFLASTPASKVEVEVVKISTPSSEEAIEDSLEDNESESNW